MEKRKTKTRKVNGNTYVTHDKRVIHHYWGDLFKLLVSWKMLAGLILFIFAVTAIGTIGDESYEKRLGIASEKSMFKSCVNACSQDYHTNHQIRLSREMTSSSEKLKYRLETPVYNDFDRTPCIKACVDMLNPIKTVHNIQVKI